jgi:hypothetical protein
MAPPYAAAPYASARAAAGAGARLRAMESTLFKWPFLVAGKACHEGSAVVASGTPLAALAFAAMNRGESGKRNYSKVRPPVSDIGTPAKSAKLRSGARLHMDAAPIGARLCQLRIWSAVVLRPRWRRSNQHWHVSDSSTIRLGNDDVHYMWLSDA